MGLRLEDFTGDHVSDWAELALRFTLSQPGVSTAIIGTTNPDNARTNIEFAAKPPLRTQSIRDIREAFSRARKKAGRPWPGLT